MYLAATTNTTVMTYVERGTCQKISPRVVAPHSQPPRRPALHVVGRSTQSLGRCPGSFSFETDPEDENQTTQQGQERTTGPDPHTEPEKKARGQGRPHSQDTKRHAPGNGRTDEPENKVAFPTFWFDLRGGTLAVLQSCRVSLFSSLASATMRTRQERATPDPHPVCTARCDQKPSGHGEDEV